MADYYDDTRLCDHCEKETLHNCRDSTHERDSSDDYQSCNDCGWYKTGYDSKYHEPSPSDLADLAERKAESRYERLPMPKEYTGPTKPYYGINWAGL